MWKIINSIQGSDLINVNIRRKLLSRAGANIHSSAIISSRIYFGSPKLRIGDGAFINVGCFFDGCALIDVHSMARCGPHVKVLTGTHPIASSVVRRDPEDPLIRSPVVIGRGCWVGLGAILLPGVTLAEGCVIAAGAVVTTSTDPNGLYAGVPARRIKDLPTSGTLS